jgi:hypothetical protein
MNTIKERIETSIEAQLRDMNEKNARNLAIDMMKACRLTLHQKFCTPARCVGACEELHKELDRLSKLG